MLAQGKYQRMLDKDIQPTERKIASTIGAQRTKHWKEVRQFLKKNYDFKPEFLYYGKKYGWCYRYRRKGKTLCVLFPETKAFNVLVVLGKNEIAQFKQMSSGFNKDTQNKFATAHKYHDGKWIYKRVLTKGDLKDVIAMIKIKKPPKK